MKIFDRSSGPIPARFKTAGPIAGLIVHCLELRPREFVLEKRCSLFRRLYPTLRRCHFRDALLSINVFVSFP